MSAGEEAVERLASHLWLENYLGGNRDVYLWRDVSPEMKTWWMERARRAMVDCGLGPVDSGLAEIDILRGIVLRYVKTFGTNAPTLTEGHVKRWPSGQKYGDHVCMGCGGHRAVPTCEDPDCPLMRLLKGLCPREVACETCGGEGWRYVGVDPGEAAGETAECSRCGGSGREP